MGYKIDDGTMTNQELLSIDKNRKSKMEEIQSTVSIKRNKKTGATESNDKALSINSSNPIIAAGERIIEAVTTNYSLSNDDTSILADVNKFAENLKITSILGIEGAPYQFLPSVDRRVNLSKLDPNMQDSFTDKSVYLGRKYVEKIVTQMPLLFLAPCNPEFMSDKTWTGSDVEVAISGLMGAITNNLDDLLKGSGRFYSAKYAYTQYYNYLNVMLSSVATFLGIGDETVRIGDSLVKLADADWSKELNADFTNTYLSKQNLVFYMDSIDTINENFSNQTMQSQIAGLINGLSETAKEIDYFFGSASGNLISDIKSKAGDAIGSIGSAASSLLGDNITGGIVGSVMNGGIQSIIDGGKIVFPEMWADSSYDKSYSIGIKLRSPDNDSLSIFLNVLKPYCKILAMTLPHMVGDNVNTYRTPFICKAYCKGLFNIDLGMITGLSVSKGATCAWNDDGLPTQIDLDIEIKDLYSQLTMTGFEDDSVGNASGIIKSSLSSLVHGPKQIYNIVNNTSYMDFLANMAGLNINEMEWTRKATMYYDLFTNRLVNAPHEIVGNRITGAITQFMSRIYNLL